MTPSLFLSFNTNLQSKNLIFFISKIQKFRSRIFSSSSESFFFSELTLFVEVTVLAKWCFLRPVGVGSQVRVTKIISSALLGSRIKFTAYALNGVKEAKKWFWITKNALLRKLSDDKKSWERRKTLFLKLQKNRICWL